jgi:putative FmdB family regulatory protein
MPLYEFQCLDCGSKFEERRSFSQADEPARCAHCSGERTRKLFGSVMVLTGNSRSTPQTTSSPATGFGGCGCGGGSCGCH